MTLNVFSTDGPLDSCVFYGVLLSSVVESRGTRSYVQELLAQGIVPCEF